MWEPTVDQVCDVTSQELVVGEDVYVANIQIMSCEMTKFQVSRHFVARYEFMSRKSDIML